MQMWKVLGLIAVMSLLGCRGQHPGGPRTVGGDLPVTSSNSVALPGATDAADAPRAPSVAEPRSTALTVYRDPATGVSFQYPTAWRPANAAEDLPAPDFEQVAGSPRMTQVFVPKGTAFEATNLQALSFSHTVKRGVLAAGCTAIPAKAVGGSAGTTKVSYNDTSYAEASGNDAGACHRLTAQVDSTLKDGECLVFERDFATTCPGLDGSGSPQALTDAQSTTLKQHLDAIMQSVAISPK